VILWFVGPAVAIVWMVFRSPMADHRMVALGAVLPLLEVLTGGPRVLHTLLGAVVALGVVMALTRNRRLVRRRWLGIPIGLFLHLVLDGTFTRADLFWWPFLGLDLGAGGLPEIDRPLGVIVLLELLGAVACGWCYRAFGLEDRTRRDTFLRTGQIDRTLLPPEARS
jgi:membrane-bound metal-dependent hydrolase YbcI (DUF457 family)